MQSVQRCEDDVMKGTGMVLGKGKGTSRGCEAPRGRDSRKSLPCLGLRGQGEAQSYRAGL